MCGCEECFRIDDDGCPEAAMFESDICVQCDDGDHI